MQRIIKTVNRESVDNFHLWSYVAQPVLGAMVGGPIGVAPAVLASSLVGGVGLSLAPEQVAVQSFLALGALIALDMALGTIKSLWVDRAGFSSTKFGKGVVKSFFVFHVPVAFWLLAKVDPVLFQPFHLLFTVSVIYFGCWEMASILKNAGRCGLPIPDSWLRTLSGTMSKAGEDFPSFQRDDTNAPQTTIRRERSRPEGEALGQAGDQEGKGQGSSPGNP